MSNCIECGDKAYQHCIECDLWVCDAHVANDDTAIICKDCLAEVIRCREETADMIRNMDRR